MTISDSTVAVIGAGTIGSTLARHFAAGGQDILLTSRDVETAAKLAASLDGHAEAVTVDEAVGRADVLVVAVWLPDFREFIAQYGGQLASKVIVDPSNPVGPDGAGGYRKVIGEQESSGQILAGLLPAGARLVKAFNTQGAESLTNPVYNGVRATNFFCGDDVAAKRVVQGLVEDVGFEAVDVGPLRNARFLEPLTLLWVSATQALGTREIAFKLLRR